MEIEYTAAFLRQLRRLSRRYRHIREDIEPVIRKLQVDKLLGDQIPHVGLTLFKVHVPNRDSQRGKRSGYRVIYYLKTDEHIILVTIYSKFNQGDITAEQVRTILAEHETPRLNRS
jgi:mRNA-degrading endonuclease RelE of RelBE toxin-antitoxin system